MNVFLPPPPAPNSPSKEWELWYETLQKLLTPTCTTSGDADAVISSGSNYHGVTALSAPRTKTLPSTKKYLEGAILVVQDESNQAGTHTITMAADTGDTAVGAVTITSNRGRRYFIRRGTVWFGA